MSRVNTNPLKHLFNAYCARYASDRDVQFTDNIKTIKDVWYVLSTKLQNDQPTIARQIADLMKMDVAQDLFNTPKKAVRLLAYKKAVNHYALPIEEDENGRVTVAIANPFDDDIIEHIGFIFNKNFNLVIAAPDDIEVAIAKAYEDLDRRQHFGKSLNLDVQSKGETSSIPELARKILLRGLEKKVSDIHIQPFIGGSAVRIRIDGMLHRMAILPESVSQSLIRYFKNQSGMDSTSTLLPQDGRMTLEYQQDKHDLRLSILPVAGRQEKLVIRLLHKSKTYSLTSIGLSLDEIHFMRRLVSYPSGVVLMCGPTGSGKTTTLYSILSELNTEQISIATVEDPVEYMMPGLAQTEVNTKSGLTFAKTLRAVLRQDPDIVLVGEIRDEETASIAMQSALTGHLVLSTLHTNDALSAIPRLQDLNVQPAILSEALTGIVSQRLFRKLCEDCKEKNDPEHLSPADDLFRNVTHSMPAYKPGGCETCFYTGYRGRIPITEIIELTPAMRSLIHKQVGDYNRLEESLDKHFVSIAVATSRRIISGETSVMEAVRVLGHSFLQSISKVYNKDDVDLSSLYMNEIDLVAGNVGVLICGDIEECPKELSDGLKESWLTLYPGLTPDECNEELHRKDNIGFVILFIPHNLSEAEVLEYIREYRQAMAWSRLPALLLLSEEMMSMKAAIREDGATSKMLPLTTRPEEVISEIHHALAEHADYNWGVESEQE